MLNEPEEQTEDKMKKTSCEFQEVGTLSNINQCLAGKIRKTLMNIL